MAALRPDEELRLRATEMEEEEGMVRFPQPNFRSPGTPLPVPPKIGPW